MALDWTTRAIGIATLLLGAHLARAQQPENHKTVAVLEYRAGARGAAGIGERLATLLAQNAALDVIGPQEARRRAGARIDAQVARCGGDPTCIAGIGENLHAREVLLVGVSQLGDVILAMQRIDVARGTAGARLAESLAPDSEPTDEEIVGWLRQLFPPDVFKRYGSIKVVSDVSGAQVAFNGEYQGRTPIAGAIKVSAPQTYKVRVTKPGFVPFQAGIDVLPDATVEVRVALTRESQPVPWFKKWYVWAAVGGAVAIAGASVAIYYGTRVDETPMGFIDAPARPPATMTMSLP